MRDDFTDEEIARGFEMAQALGVKIITTSATVSVTPRIAAQAEKYKMVVGMHGHSNIKDPNEFAKPESFVEAMKLSPYIAVNLDIGHYWAAGYDPVAYIEEHHERIVTLHIKDRKKNQGKNMPFGEGDTPIREVLQLLRAQEVPDSGQHRIRIRGRRYGGGSAQVLRVLPARAGLSKFFASGPI